MKRFISVLFAIILINLANAQIGYQVSLIDNATGEPRANEKVNVTVELSFSGGTILREDKTATTNDFGVLSLSVGNSSTFENFDWDKLPLYISATINGTLIGKSQILTVPIAEHAKHTGVLTKDILKGKKWIARSDHWVWHLIFDDETCIWEEFAMFDDGSMKIHSSERFPYEINGNAVGGGRHLYLYFPKSGTLIGHSMKFVPN